jgi:presenilin-like A22 family membrane protease
MKHSVKITLLLLSMFFVTQLIGLFVLSQYPPQINQIQDDQGNIKNLTSYNYPYGLDPPQDITPQATLISIIFAVAIALFLMLILMKYNAELFLRIWFFTVVSLAIGITINSVIQSIQYSSIIAMVLALPLAYFKIFKKNLIVHNLTELIIYPGIAVLFVPLLSIWTVVLLLILISIYDMYAVWHAGFMQKMAMYQIKTLKVFTGFFVPYLGDKKQRASLAKAQKSKSKALKNKKVKVSVAILGGGDVVFPIILAGVVLRTLGLFPAILISIGATLALAALFYMSKKGKFYPAMPFITAGCFIALAIAYLV